MEKENSKALFRVYSMLSGQYEFEGTREECEKYRKTFEHADNTLLILKKK